MRLGDSSRIRYRRKTEPEHRCIAQIWEEVLITRISVIAAAVMTASSTFSSPVFAHQDRAAEANERVSVIVSNADLIRELAGMGALDQTMRTGFLDIRRNASPSEREAMDREIGAKIDAVDEVHERRLKEILTDHEGWFPKSQFGDRAATAAYQIVQHSTDQSFKREVIERMRPLVGTPELNGDQFARMVDRYELGEGRQQVYGTQGTRCQDGRYVVPSDILAPETLEERRRTLGMEPMSEYLSQLQTLYGHC